MDSPRRGCARMTTSVYNDSSSRMTPHQEEPSKRLQAFCAIMAVRTWWMLAARDSTMHHHMIGLLVLAFAVDIAPVLSMQALPASQHVGYVQFIHVIADTGPLDVYVDNRRILDSLDYRDASAFMPITHGPHRITYYLAGDSVRSDPVLEEQKVILTNVRYVAAGIGDRTDIHLQWRDSVREKSHANQVEFFLIHGAAHVGAVNLRYYDVLTGDILGLLYNRLEYGGYGIYLGLPYGVYNFEFVSPTDGQVLAFVRVDIRGYSKQSLVFATSGADTTSGAELTLTGYDISGTNILITHINTSTERLQELPTSATLEGNYPNPFTPATHIPYVLSGDATVRLDITDLLGRSVTTLVDTWQAARSYTVTWDGTTDSGARAPGGVYICRLVANGRMQTRRLTLMR